MSQRATDFVSDWIAENIHAEPYVSEDGDDPRCKEYAEQCLIAAEQQGIPRDEIIGSHEPLEDVMAQAIDESADNEVDRLAAKDG